MRPLAQPGWPACVVPTHLQAAAAILGLVFVLLAAQAAEEAQRCILRLLLLLAGRRQRQLLLVEGRQRRLDAAQLAACCRGRWRCLPLARHCHRSCCLLQELIAACRIEGGGCGAWV